MQRCQIQPHLSTDTVLSEILNLDGHVLATWYHCIIVKVKKFRCLIDLVLILINNIPKYRVFI